MATKRKEPEQKPELRLRMSVEDARARLAERVKLGQELKGVPIQSMEQLRQTRNDYDTWNDYNHELLRQMFTNQEPADDYSFAALLGGGGRGTLLEEIHELHDDVDRRIHRLQSLSGRLELIPLSDEVRGRLDVPVNTEQLSNSKVFLVHGHDERARETVARFLEKLRLDVIILHEQANQGMTIIEKLEKYSDVGFAVVLLTPDDEGRKVVEGEVLKPRARQNVILELGYFVGRIGRRRVLALHNGSLELPSDYLGVVYVPLDAGGGWRLALAKELRTARFLVDMNDAL